MIFILQRRHQIIPLMIFKKIKMQKKSVLFFFIGISIVYLISCQKKPISPIEQTIFALDTVVHIKIYDTENMEILEQAMQMVQDYEKIFSAHHQEAELYRLNHRPRSMQEIEISKELAEVIAKGLYYATLSEGKFDISIAPVQELWDFESDIPKLPNEKALKEALKKVDYQAISLNGQTISFTNPDTMIDLGSIAKGYIADKIREYLLSQGVKSALINLGGNVLCIGKKPNGEYFQIGLQKPFKDREETIGAVEVEDVSVVSSGVYERNFFLDGVNFHHILDSTTGYPYQNGIAQVSIIAESSCEADVLSTTCFVLGVERASQFIESLSRTYAIFVMEDGEIIYTRGTEEILK